MEPLDAPIPLKYIQGKLFPTNAVFSGYIFLGIAIFCLVVGSWIIGLVLAILGAFICFSFTDIQIFPARKECVESTYYLGFIPARKSIDISKWQLISVIPSRQTQTMYARSSTSTSITDVYFCVTLLKSNFRAKKELVKFENKSRSYEVAKGIGKQMGLDLFEYDPQVVRDAFRR